MQYAWLVLMTVVLALTACSNGQSATSLPVASQQSSPAPVFFLQQPPVNGEPRGMASLITGQLIVFNTCLGINGGVIVWPSNVVLHVENDVIQIRKQTGEVLVQVGDTVALDGGWVTGLESSWITGRSWKQVRDACPGPYWLVGKEIRRVISPPEASTTSNPSQ